MGLYEQKIVVYNNVTIASKCQKAHVPLFSGHTENSEPHFAF